MNRRRLLSSAAAVPLLAAVLAACTQAQQTQIQTDSALVTAAAQAIATAVLASPNISPGNVALINSAVATIEQANQAIQQATATPGGPAQEIAAALRLLAPVVLQYVAAGSSEAIAINAAVALIPVILQAAGVAMPFISTAQANSAAQARLVLKGYLARR